MKKLFLVCILILIPSFASAHPGRTASDGCHYCRTNCEKWGVPKGVRHCHNGNSIDRPKIKSKTKPDIEEKTKKEFPFIYKIFTPGSSPSNPIPTVTQELIFVEDEVL